MPPWPIPPPMPPWPIPPPPIRLAGKFEIRDPPPGLRFGLLPDGSDGRFPPAMPPPTLGRPPPPMLGRLPPPMFDGLDTDGREAPPPPIFGRLMDGELPIERPPEGRDIPPDGRDIPPEGRDMPPEGREIPPPPPPARPPPPPRPPPPLNPPPRPPRPKAMSVESIPTTAIPTAINIQNRVFIALSPVTLN